MPSDQCNLFPDLIALSPEDHLQEVLTVPVLSVKLLYPRVNIHTHVNMAKQEVGNYLDLSWTLLPALPGLSLPSHVLSGLSDSM